MEPRTTGNLRIDRSEGKRKSGAEEVRFTKCGAMHCNTPRSRVPHGSLGAFTNKADSQRLITWIDPSSEPGWDGLVEEVGGNFFHTAAWAEVLSQSYSLKPCYPVLSAKLGKSAFLALQEASSWLRAPRGICLPFTDECYPAASDPAQFEELLQASLARGRQAKWRYLELRGGRKFLADAPVWRRYCGHELELDQSEEVVFGRFHESVRRAIRKARASQLDVEVGNSFEAVNAFYILNCRTRRKHGLPPQPFSFFQRVHQHVMAKGMGTVVTARFRGKPIASSVFFHFGDQAIFKYSASDERFLGTRANNLVMHEGIKWYSAKGFHRLDLGRTEMDNVGLRRYKRGWGALERTIEYFRYDFGRQSFIRGREETWKWWNEVFRCLPLPVLRIMGGVLYRHIA